VKDPVKSRGYSNDASVVVSRGNLYIDSYGDMEDKAGALFTPPYAYSVDDVYALQGAVVNGAGPCAANRVFQPVPARCSNATGAM
jgi:hypothetical protein